MTLELFKGGRSLILDEIAREQAIVDSANETDLTEEDAANLNTASFRNRGDRNFFENQYRRHAPQHSCRQPLLQLTQTGKDNDP